MAWTGFPITQTEAGALGKAEPKILPTHSLAWELAKQKTLWKKINFLQQILQIRPDLSFVSTTYYFRATSNYKKKQKKGITFSLTGEPIERNKILADLNLWTEISFTS